MSHADVFAPDEHKKNRVPSPLCAVSADTAPDGKPKVWLVKVDDQIKEQVLSRLHYLFGCKMNLPLPRALNRHRLKQIHPSSVLFGHKADGERFLLALLHLGAFMVDRSKEVYRIQGLSQKGFSLYYVVDGEWMKDVQKFLAFDALIRAGQKLFLQPFAKREAQLYSTCCEMRRCIGSDMHVEHKPWFRLTAVTAMPPLEKCDGLILMDTREPWMSKRPDVAVLKHKPSPTIDVYFQEEKQESDTKEQRDEEKRQEADPLSSPNPLRRTLSVWYEDAVGQRQVLEKQKVEIVCDVPTGCRVVELQWNGKNWVFFKFRPDRMTANYCSVIEETVLLAQDNLTLDDLLQVFAPAHKRKREL